MRSPLQVIQSQPQLGRKWRRPQHTWNTRFMPWQAQPVFLAPVIPGETLKNAAYQMRTVTDPVSNRLIGWWHEFYMYYVPLLSMGDEEFQENMKSMLLDPNFDAATAGLTSNTANTDTGFNGRAQVDWTRRALDTVIDYDFRNDNERDKTFEINGLPALSISNRNWTDSALADSEMQNWDVDVDAGSDDVLQASEIEEAMKQYEVLKMHGLVEMTYEDYLRTFGIRGRAVQEHKGPQPEMLRYSRDFQYPSNTVDAQSNVASAISWSIAGRADKDRFFKHPGFVLGFQTARPKVYMSGLTGQAAHSMLRLADWLPAVLRDDPLSSLKQFAHQEGPLATGPTDGDEGNQGYWLDLRDLLLYGDQFVNSGTEYSVDLPRDDLERRYPVIAEAYALFNEAEPSASKASLNHVESDGVINLGILGAETDHTAQRSSFEPTAE